MKEFIAKKKAQSLPKQIQKISVIWYHMCVWQGT
jgi:hypothetical protein